MDNTDEKSLLDKEISAWKSFAHLFNNNEDSEKLFNAMIDSGEIKLSVFCIRQANFDWMDKLKTCGYLESEIVNRVPNSSEYLTKNPYVVKCKYLQGDCAWTKIDGKTAEIIVKKSNYDKKGNHICLCVNDGEEYIIPDDALCSKQIAPMAPYRK